MVSFGSLKDDNLLKKVIEVIEDNKLYTYEQIKSIVGSEYLNAKTFTYFTSIDDYKMSSCNFMDCIVEWLNEDVLPDVLENTKKRVSDVMPSIISTPVQDTDSNIDILILIATEAEENAIRNLREWHLKSLHNILDYYLTNINHLKIALVRGAEMIETDVAIIGQIAISELHPKYIAMAGFCAGLAGKVELGDIIVPNKIYRYGEGKRISETELSPDMSCHDLKQDWVIKAQRFKETWRYNCPNTNYNPKIRVEPMATGSDVQEWDGAFELLLTKYDRKTIALDMEAHAVPKLAGYNNIPWFVAKGVADFAEKGKAEHNKAFITLAYQSAFTFIVEFLTLIDSKQLIKERMSVPASNKTGERLDPYE